MATREQLIAFAKEAEAHGDYAAANKAADMLLAMQPTTMQKIGGMAEIGANLISGAIAEPVAGLAGLVSAPFTSDRTGADVVGAVRELGTYKPRSEAGRGYMQATGEVLAPIGEAINTATQGSGDFVYNVTGSPALGALATAAPIAAMEALSFGAGKAGSSMARRASGGESPSVATLKRQGVVEAGRQASIPIMTSDVFPPKTWAGKSMQSLSEKLGVLGTGNMRAKQQAAREAAVSGMADELGIDIDTPFADSVVRSLNAKNAKVMEQAGSQRARAEAILDPAGGLEPKRAISEIDNILSKQSRLGKNANSKIVAPLQNLRDELVKNPSFSLAREHRSKIIKDIIAARRGEDVSPAAALSRVKQSLDKDLISFANKVDKGAAKDWLHSNRKMAEELQLVKETELRRVLEGGEATPEIVMPILTGGKPSQLKRMYSSLGEKGRESAKKAIIQDALKRSGFFATGDAPKSIKFQNALSTPAMINATKVFFPGEEGKALNGLMLALEKTRAAQTGQQFAKTGESVVPSAVAGGVVGKLAYDPASAVATLSGVAIASGALKLYESAAFRNLLIRLNNIDPKSAAYNDVAGMATAAITGAAIEESRKQKAGNNDQPELNPNEQQPSNLQNIFPDPNAMLNQAKQVERQERFAQSLQNVEKKAADMASAYKLPTDKKLAIDMQTIASNPKYVGMALLNDLYDGDQSHIKIAENFIKVAMNNPKYRPSLQAVKNVLLNANVIPPDNKQDMISSLVSVGIKPEKAATIANTLRPLKPKEARKIADAIRAKITPEMYSDFAPLIGSIEALT